MENILTIFEQYLHFGLTVPQVISFYVAAEQFRVLLSNMPSIIRNRKRAYKFRYFFVLLFT